MTVGIVLVNYNGSELLKMTLDSMRRAKVQTKYVVCLIENGSGFDDYHAAESAFWEFKNARRESDLDVFYRSQSNLGFCGGNNIGIRKLLENDEVERICLLNTDVIVTDGWLDRLIASDADIVGPVTNANGNEQTIWIDYCAEQNESAFDAANEFAQFRGKVYHGYEVPAKCVTGFCSMIKREVFEEIGLLDERYYPGGFDDCDYDRRALEVGKSVAIRRDCYIHHWGGGSFSKLSSSTRIGISFANMIRYEEKWNTQWEGTQYLLPVSLLQDVEHLKNNGENDARAWKLIDETCKAIGEILKNYEIARLKEDKNTYRNSIDTQLKGKKSVTEEESTNTEKAPSGTSRNEIVTIPFYPDPGFQRVIKGMVDACGTIYHSIRAPGRRRRALQDVLNFIRSGSEKGKGTVAIIGPMWREERMRDGYMQRIAVVDQVVLAGYKKLYFQKDRTIPFSVEVVDKEHMVVHFPPTDKECIGSIEMLMKACGLVYVHSLLRLVHSEMMPSLLKWLVDDHIKLVWDVHGSVPEEAILCDDWRGAQTYNTLEEILMRGANVMICVNHAMIEHYQKKYAYIHQKPMQIVMPIFSGVDTSEKYVLNKLNYSDYSIPVVVYSGGLQRWQNVALMQDIMSTTGRLYRYNIIVSDPANFEETYGDRPMPPGTEITSLPPNKVPTIYERSHFGFVLRDDIVVNNVACPTKLIEYMCYGVLPIIKTEHIGDFVRYGMNYIHWEDFAAGEIPAEDEYRKMIQHNRSIIDQFQMDFENGRKQLLDFIGGNT